MIERDRELIVLLNIESLKQNKIPYYITQYNGTEQQQNRNKLKNVAKCYSIFFLSSVVHPLKNKFYF